MALTDEYCEHYRLNEDGVCRRCGLSPFAPTAPAEPPKSPVTHDTTPEECALCAAAPEDERYTEALQMLHNVHSKAAIASLIAIEKTKSWNEALEMLAAKSDAAAVEWELRAKGTTNGLDEWKCKALAESERVFARQVRGMQKSTKRVADCASCQFRVWTSNGWSCYQYQVVMAFGKGPLCTAARKGACGASGKFYVYNGGG